MSLPRPAALLILLSLIAAPPAVAQPAPPKVAIAAAYTQQITDEAVFIGKGEAVDRVEIVARVAGFVDEIAVRNGAVVEAGQLLFRIEDESYAANVTARQADLGKAEASLDLAEIELARKEELFARGSAPESERDIARANQRTAAAVVKSAQAALRQAELELSYTEVRAPFDGRLGRISVSPGELVGPATAPLVTLVREAPIFVRFALSDRQLGRLLEQFDATVNDLTDPEGSPKVFVTLPTGTELESPGRIVFVDNAISPSTGTIAVIAEFANERQLIIDGAFVHVRIEALEPVERLLVPQAAVQRDQRGDFVLVVGADQMVEQRYVTLGAPAGAAVIVTEGLREGEAVIVEGLQRVRPGVQVDAILAGRSERP